jgi:hypothetical protein
MRCALAVVALALGACTSQPASPGGVGMPLQVDARGEMAAAVQFQPDLTGAQVIARAHAAAGGESWVRPQSLKLTGYNIIRREDGAEILWDRYTMWRVYADEKADAHVASGKVRIEAWSADALALLIAFDGTQTYNQDGPLADQSGNAVWANSFGFGAIRNALDPGWSQARQPDRLIDGASAFMVALTDPSGGNTLFGIRQSDAAIVYVGFQTPRGWHERYYSHFFEKPGIDWVQPGRVRLVYDGVKANEAIWTDFEVNGVVDDGVFVISGGD